MKWEDNVSQINNLLPKLNNRFEIYQDVIKRYKIIHLDSETKRFQGLVVNRRTGEILKYKPEAFEELLTNCKDWKVRYSNSWEGLVWTIWY